MKCYECAAEMKERMTTLHSPYHYDESGLRNIALVGIKVHCCSKCKMESAVIPKIGQLNDLIAKILLEKKELLTGEELRFLRKYAAFPGKEFAMLLNITPSYLSRFENEKEKSENLSKTADKLARAIVAAARDQECIKGILLKVAEKIEKRNHGKARENKLQLIKNRWQECPAA
jgi:transcriptional regulator with XRE-family HTH domain